MDPKGINQMKGDDLFFDMVQKYNQNYHSYYRKNCDEKSFTTYLYTKVDLLYCERLLHDKELAPLHGYVVKSEVNLVGMNNQKNPKGL